MKQRGGVLPLRTFNLIKFVVDIFIVHAGYVAAFLIRYDGFPAYNWSAYLKTAPWITIAAAVIFWGYGFYSPLRRSRDEIISAVICALALLFLSSMAISYLLYQFAFPRVIILLGAAIQFVFLFCWRNLTYKYYQGRFGPLRFLIIGSGADALERARFFSAEDNEMYSVAGLLIENSGEQPEPEHEYPVLVSYDQLPEALERFQPNSVILCPGIPQKIRLKLLTDVMTAGLKVFVIPDLYEILLHRSHLEQVNSFPALQLVGYFHVRDPLWKRAVDLVLVLVFALPAALLVCLASLVLKIESPRQPVFYRQKRVTRGGKIFDLLKLRTMIPDAERGTGPVLSDSNDERVTVVGRILRAARIDELPQLWNVLKGEMSFVGPRPERPFFVEQFVREIPGYKYRHHVKSGITGLAQVEGKYSTAANDKLRFDLIYAQNMSPLSDLHILLHTAKVMLLKRKSV